jgi:hypothetical protein
MENASEKSSKVARPTPKKALAKKKAVTTQKKAAPTKPKVKAAKKVATVEIKPAKEKGKKKILREQIADTLETTFAGLKEALGDKKFSRHIKKASKVLAAGAIKKTKHNKKTDDV